MTERKHITAELTAVSAELLSTLPWAAALLEKAAYGPIRRVSVTRAMHEDQDRLRRLALRLIRLRDELMEEGNGNDR